MLWWDTTNDLIRIRNSANDAWITLFKLDQALDEVDYIDLSQLRHAGNTNTKVVFTTDDISLQTDGAEVLGVQGEGIEVTGGILLNERADHANTPVAGKGEFWVSNDTTQVPHFTDDAGTDIDLRPLGVGQTWQDVSGSRAFDTSYQNTTGRPIMFFAQGVDNTELYMQVSSDNATWITVGKGGGHGNAIDNDGGGAIVPPDWYYRFLDGSSATLAEWTELR
jgi:hypothetical protein